jgi:hypothetical protein
MMPLAMRTVPDSAGYAATDKDVTRNGVERVLPQSVAARLGAALLTVDPEPKPFGFEQLFGGPHDFHAELVLSGPNGVGQSRLRIGMPLWDAQAKVRRRTASVGSGMIGLSGRVLPPASSRTV